MVALPPETLDHSFFSFFSALPVRVRWRRRRRWPLATVPLDPATEPPWPAIPSSTLSSLPSPLSVRSAHRDEHGAAAAMAAGGVAAPPPAPSPFFSFSSLLSTRAAAATELRSWPRQHAGVEAQRRLRPPGRRARSPERERAAVLRLCGGVHGPSSRVKAARSVPRAGGHVPVIRRRRSLPVRQWPAEMPAARPRQAPPPLF